MRERHGIKMNRVLMMIMAAGAVAGGIERIRSQIRGGISVPWPHRLIHGGNDVSCAGALRGSGEGHYSLL